MRYHGAPACPARNNTERCGGADTNFTVGARASRENVRRVAISLRNQLSAATRELISRRRQPRREVMDSGSDNQSLCARMTAAYRGGARPLNGGSFCHSGTRASARGPGIPNPCPRESGEPIQDYGFRARRTQPSLRRLRKHDAAAPRNDRSIGVWKSPMQWRAPRVTQGALHFQPWTYALLLSPPGGPSGLGGGELTSSSAALVSRSIRSLTSDQYSSDQCSAISIWRRPRRCSRSGS